MWEMAPGGLTACLRARHPRSHLGTRCNGGRCTAPAGRGPRCRVLAGGTSRPRSWTIPSRFGWSMATPAACPMGADLTKAPAGKAPSFMIKATYDADGAYLDRVQIVKGWLDDRGDTHEKVIDVAWSGDRKPDAKTGQVPLVGNTVDVKNATWTNTIGAPLLTGFWQDPDFDPGQRAFYYVRVIEIPTPRWTAYDCTASASRWTLEVPMTVRIGLHVPILV